jgi:hypothetical protein
MSRRTTPLPPRTLTELIAAVPAYRQSILGNADNCFLSTKYELEGSRFSNSAQAAGIVWHRFMAEFLITLRRTGETRMPVEEAMVILREVCRQRDVPPEEIVVLSAKARRLLRIALLKLVSGQEFHMARLIDVERQLETTVTYDHPEHGHVERRITGTPDALVADPPDGILCIDWKLSRAAPPPTPEDHAARDDGDPAHVSYLGYWQQRFYALLIMREFKSVERITLREFYPLLGEARTATVHRNALEHIEDEISTVVELLDRALMGGSKSPMWQPSPGRHCGFCRRPTACPLEADERALQGGITSRAQAKKLAAEYVVTKQVGKALHEALKAHVDLHGPLPVKSAKGRAELRWKTNKGGGRSFGLAVPDDSDRGPDDPDLAAAFTEAAERKRSTA